MTIVGISGNGVYSEGYKFYSGVMGCTVGIRVDIGLIRSAMGAI